MMFEGDEIIRHAEPILQLICKYANEKNVQHGMMSEITVQITCIYCYFLT